MSKRLLIIAACVWAATAAAQETDFLADPGKVLKITMPASGGGCVSGVPPADATALIQGCLNSAAGAEVVIPCGTWNTGTGFTIPAAGAVVTFVPGCATIHLTANVTAFSCSAISTPVVIRNGRITGTAANYNGTINISDSGQAGIHVINCPSVSVDNVLLSNLSGTAIDCENPAGGFNVVAALRFTNVTVFNSYRGINPHNSCEYALFAHLTVRNNIFGAVVAAGNVAVDGFLFSNNYNNIQIIGQSNSNPCHGTFSNGMSNHGNYNLDVLSCGLGEDFVNVRFIGDAGGTLTTGGLIRIANSRGVNIVGGEMGSNLTVLQVDPATGASAAAGANKLEGTYVRDDIAGFVNPSIGYAGGLEMKLNFTAAGQWSQNN